MKKFTIKKYLLMEQEVEILAENEEAAIEAAAKFDNPLDLHNCRVTDMSEDGMHETEILAAEDVEPLEQVKEEAERLLEAVSENYTSIESIGSIAIDYECHGLNEHNDYDEWTEHTISCWYDYSTGIDIICNNGDTIDIAILSEAQQLAVCRDIIASAEKIRNNKG